MKSRRGCKDTEPQAADRSVRPHTYTPAGFALGFALQLHAVAHYTRPPGNDHPLLGTGTGLPSALDVVGYRLPGGALIGLGASMFIVGAFRYKAGVSKS